MTSISVILVSQGPTLDAARTSPPAAKESMSIARRDVVRFGSLCIMRKMDHAV